MDHESQFDQTIGLLYESALVPGRISDALRSMMGALGADFCRLAGWNRHSGAPVLSEALGVRDERSEQAYFEYYGNIDQRRRLAATMAPGDILASLEHFDTGFIARDEFYQDSLIKQLGMHYLLGASELLEHTDRSVLIAFLRETGRGPFTQEQSRNLARFLPHVRRTLHMSELVENERTAKLASETALSTSNLAVIALSSSGLVLWANTLAETLLKDAKWLCQRHGRLHAVAVDSDAALRNTLVDVVQSGHPSNLNLGYAGEHCLVTVLSAQQRALVGLPSARVELVVLASVPQEHGRVASAKQLIAYFRLSPAEARLARALALGESLDTYSSHEGIRRSTAKTQLASVMTKTGAKSQKDIVRLVASLPAIR